MKHTLILLYTLVAMQLFTACKKEPTEAGPVEEPVDTTNFSFTWDGIYTTFDTVLFIPEAPRKSYVKFYIADTIYNIRNFAPGVGQRHYFSKAGIYDVSMVVDTFESKRITHQINIRQGVQYQISGLPAVGSSINFRVYQDTLDSYLWDFGDGTTSSQPSPTHTYSVGGDYVISLKINDEYYAVGQDSLHISREPKYAKEIAKMRDWTVSSSRSNSITGLNTSGNWDTSFAVEHTGDLWLVANIPLPDPAGDLGLSYKDFTFDENLSTAQKEVYSSKEGTLTYDVSTGKIEILENYVYHVAGYGGTIFRTRAVTK